MIIVIDGPDGSGKTTLANELIKKLGATYIHATFKKGWNIFNYHTKILYKAVLHILKNKKPVIIDRLWLSEAIYAEIYRGGSAWPLQGRFFERIINRFGGINITVTTGNMLAYISQFKKLCNTRHEMFTSDYGRVAELYNQVYYGKKGVITNNEYLNYYLNNGGIDTCVNSYNYEFGTSVEEHVKNICNILPRLQTSETFKELSNFNFAGSLKYSTVLLVGDVPNMNGIKKPLWPFWYYGNSSLFLAKVINDTTLPEISLAYVDINYKNGVETTKRWLSYKSYLGQISKVICMGNEAEKTFRDNFKGVVYYRTVHPSAARRFLKYRPRFIKTFLGLKRY